MIEKSLNLFRTFVESDVPFRVIADRYIRVSPEGEYWGGGQRARSDHDPAYKLFRSIDFSEVAKFAFSSGFLASAGAILFRNSISESAGLRIAHSLHWYRKAEETRISEDRFLAYWIVLENIVSVQRSDKNVLLPTKDKETKFSLIREIIPALECCLFLSNAAATLYRYLMGLLTSKTNGRQHLTLPDSIASRPHF